MGGGDAADDRQPGADAGGIDRLFPDQRLWLGARWFTVAGVLAASPLEPTWM